ncbi:G-type lectin S-receptor-like serine/threonine-protein kinase At4g27290 [Abrus precatorius]|uniref:Receptor-like serine/threonine-protein kinase n=1 Tax=Abrus precatorius TaxID=3816 RepID=A0A8B8LFS4_ABRPR|nr:G-type lectin S-receptor-like serine/threonine-protein kinase At4g27290 [Abrus precatorius]
MTIFTVTLVIAKLFFFFFFSSKASSTTDTITLLQPLPDGSTLVSQNGTFELGFFSLRNSTNRYVGIWFKNIPIRTIVWVANRDNPLKDNSNMLSISKGNLVLLNKNGTVHWSTNATRRILSPIVQLLDTGNLVLRDKHGNNDLENFLWQSFDYPSNTLLPGMKLGYDKKTGFNRHITSWKNWDDPSPGNFTWGITLDINPEMELWNGSVKVHRSGPWNGVRFSGAFSGSNVLSTHPLYVYKLVNNDDEVYYTYNPTNKSVISIVVMNQTIYSRQRIIWIPENGTWRLFQTTPRDICDTYNPCGPYANCMVNGSLVCQCLEGFAPNSFQNSETNDLVVQGCGRSEPWACKVQGKDGFRRFVGLKFPDTTHSWINRSMTLEDCKAKCYENCSCTAYANLDVRGGGSGCSIWFGDLIDLKEVSQSGQFLYVRMANSQKDGIDDHKKMAVLISATILPTVLVILLLAISFNYWRKRKNKGKKTFITEKDEAGGQEDMELPMFDLATLVNATNNFSIDNKLGQGGFGPVYKGVLSNGQEIAVKRLSRSSVQGLKEFKNEVMLCAKLQHRNLVKVLGCCIEEEEKMLLYEYMPNKSLDLFLFDSTQSKILDWPKRFQILCAISRGLLYLHQDSRLRIIHRDLKASNILLDNNMNPKISDFGLARMCGGDQIEGNTNRVVGTYGYMAPEYVIHGLFSTKSDVFSFGILLLEIISGKKNRELTYPYHSHNLIGHTWKLWKEGIPKELIDTCLADSCNLSEALRCIHIGLLCLQHQPADRPNMASVVVMLNTESELLQPKEPGFLIDRVLNEDSQYRNQTSSTNEITISLMDAR